MMAAITGRNENDLVSYESTLNGYELCIQDLNQIPNIPQAIIRNSWEALAESYRSYAIRPKEGSKVKGRVYVLTERERELVKNFDFTDLGWHDEHQVKVSSASNAGTLDVVTDVLGEGQDISHVVDGLAYSDFLNHKETTLKGAEKAREVFLEKLIKEGMYNPTELKG